MKRTAAFCFAILLLITPMLALAETWGELFSSLSDTELIALLEAVQYEVKSRGISSSGKPEQMVWVPRSGEKYHKTSTCSNMKNPREVPLSDAIRFGYEPCKRCKP